MCRVLHVAESDFYACRKRQPSTRHCADEQLTPHIRQIVIHGRQAYGSPRVHAELRQQGIPYARKRVTRLMRLTGLNVHQKGRSCRTMDSCHTHPIASNVLQRDFQTQ